MGDRLTKDYEMAIREALASCRGEGRSWSWGNAGPFATVDETAEALAQVARNADGGAAATNLWCVHMPDPNEPGMSLYVCHTGNGPTSQAHARFFAVAPNAIRMLLAEIDALRDALRGQEAERMVAGGERPSTEATMGERLTKERDAVSDESVCSICSRPTGFGDEDKGELPVNLARCPSPAGLECRAVAQAVAPLRRENEALRSNNNHLSSENASLRADLARARELEAERDDEALAFLRRTAMTGGSIVSSAVMTARQIAIARATDRMFVAPDGYGFVYVPGPRFCDDAERAARLAAEARVRELECRIDAILSDPRVPKIAAHHPHRHLMPGLTDEQVEEGMQAYGCQEYDESCAEWRSRADKAEATLAETRAQLARLREAAEAVDEADASGDDTVLGVAIRHLRAALSTPGPTLAEIRRAAQVEVLRDAASEAELLCEPIASRRLRKRADDLEAGRG